MPAVLAFFGLGHVDRDPDSRARWPVLMAGVVTGISLLYRYGPSRENAKWRWLTWGASSPPSCGSRPPWLFSFYLQNFADYNATYGSLGAVIGL